MQRTLSIAHLTGKIGRVVSAWRDCKWSQWTQLRTVSLTVNTSDSCMDLTYIDWHVHLRSKMRHAYFDRTRWDYPSHIIAQMPTHGQWRRS